MSNNEDTQPSAVPDQPKTAQLPAVSAVEVMLARLSQDVAAGFSNVDVRLDSQDTKLDKAVTEGIEANVRLDRVETRLGKVEGRTDQLEERQTRNSTRVREDSSVDLERDAKLGLALAALAEEKAKVVALEKKAVTKAEVKTMLTEAAEEQTSAIVTGVKTLLTTPTAQKLKNAIVPVLLIAISVIGFKLTMLLQKLQEAPTQTQTVQINGAPIVDAGADR